MVQPFRAALTGSRGSRPEASRRRAGAWLAALVAACSFPAGLARAEEGGNGHYPPGSSGYLAGVLPSEPGLYWTGEGNFYIGDARGVPALPRAGRLLFNSRVFGFFDTLGVMWVTPARFLGGQFAAGVYAPLGYLSVDTRVRTPTGNPRRSETNAGLGDASLAPVMLGWRTGPWNVLASVVIYVPTGFYNTRTVAPLGSNFATVEPGIGFTYLNPRSGWEFSGYAGYDFNSINPATRYLTGQEAHLDWTVARHFRLRPATPAAAAAPGVPVIPPRGSAPIDVAPGIGGWLYQQVTPDSGKGAVLGPFRGRTFAVGPEIHVAARAGDDVVLTLELKLLKEFAVRNRPEGLASWLNFGVSY